ncbi:hypothetical protein G7Z17_g3443 [Cylindrodendrum hubeiense]|uniref:Uncharacterized protein n=1 Tax=Cylindrodendrum hubeiense TaxID=595255 RepID=A0A9P5HIV8_9HYPO|nr:hypothetical protein G7Z17_g3443 [Cylindrodendrum hubeiense]
MDAPAGPMAGSDPLERASQAPLFPVPNSEAMRIPNPIPTTARTTPETATTREPATGEGSCPARSPARGLAPRSG